MRILRIRIGSFGSLFDKEYTLDPGLNVVYGSNEAGKSTLRSFITNTLFSKTNVRYPETRRSDCGKLEVEMSDGGRRTIERDGKKSIGCVDAECGISGREYTSIYSMQPDDLRNTADLEKGDIRNRFLTIPGGNDLPKVYRDLKEERTSYVPDGRRSEKSRMSVLIRKYSEAKEEVLRLQMREDGDAYYNSLVERERTLSEEIEKARAETEACEKVRSRAGLEKEREKTRETMAGLEEQERALSYAGRYGEEDRRRGALLQDAFERSDRDAKAAEKDYEAAERLLDGRDIPAVYRHMDDIGYLNSQRQRYRELNMRPKTRTEEKPHASGRKGGLLPLAGIVLIAAGAVLTVYGTMAGIAVIVAGAVAAAVPFLRRRVGSPRNTDTSGPDVRKELERLERLADRVAEDVGIERTSFDTCVTSLNTVRDLVHALEKADRDRNGERAKRDRAKDELDLFYSGFGGEEGFDRAMKDMDSLKDVRARLSALREGTNASEQAADVDPEKAEEDYSSAKNRLNGLSEEYGRTAQALKNIEDDLTVEDAITERSLAENRVYSAAKEWASLMLQQLILDEASKEMYSENRPDVVMNADRFLSLMTDGRYGMASEPSSDDLMVRDLVTGDLKNSKQWSTGLEDQVKLSLKMAVSLSLSAERPPVILDDVLLTSDSGRKAGACEAIAKLSRDIQVIYFTCDRETRDLMEGTGARIIAV